MHRKRVVNGWKMDHVIAVWRPLVRSYLQTQHFSKDVQFLHLDLHRFPLRVFFSSSLAHEDCRFFSWTFVRFSFCWFFSSWFLGRIQLPVQWTGWVLVEITAGHRFHRFFVLPLKSLTFSLLRYVFLYWRISLLVWKNFQKRSNFQWFGDCWKEGIRENSLKAMTQWMWILNS